MLGNNLDLTLMRIGVNPYSILGAQITAILVETTHFADIFFEDRMERVNIECELIMWSAY